MLVRKSRNPLYGRMKSVQNRPFPQQNYFFWHLPSEHLPNFGTFRRTFIKKNPLYNAWKRIEPWECQPRKKNPLKKCRTWVSNRLFLDRPFSSIRKKIYLGRVIQRKKNPLKKGRTWCQIGFWTNFLSSNRRKKSPL